MMEYLINTVEMDDDLNKNIEKIANWQKYNTNWQKYNTNWQKYNDNWQKIFSNWNFIVF